METIIDSIDLGTVEGFDIRADLVPDTDSSLGDGEYTTDQQDAFNSGMWGFAGIIVTASRSDITLGSDSLWGVEYGGYPGYTNSDGIPSDIDPLNDKDGSLAYYRADLIDNAIADARMTLSNLVDAAIDDSME